MRGNDCEVWEQIRNFCKHIGRAVYQTWGIGIPARMKSYGQTQFFRLRIDGQRSVVADEEFLIIRMKLDTIPVSYTHLAV